MTIANVPLKKIDAIAWKIEQLACCIMALSDATVTASQDRDEDNCQPGWLLKTIKDTASRVHELSCNIRGY